MRRQNFGLLSLAGLLVGLAAYGANAQSGNFTTFADFVAAYNGTDLTIFTAALNKTGLTDTVANYSDGTVFIPNDAAFASFATSLGLSNATALLSLPMDTLTALLKYHVVSHKVTINTANFTDNPILKPSDWVTIYQRLPTLAPSVTAMNYLNLTTNITDWKSSTVKSPWATAKLVSNVTEPFTFVGTVRMAVINSVMAWWYSSIADAISDNDRLVTLKQSLVNNGLWANLNNKELSLTLFAPYDVALLPRFNYNINATDNSTTVRNMLTYLHTYGTNNANFSADIQASYTYTSLYNNMTLVVNQTGANSVTVKSVGTTAKVITATGTGTGVTGMIQIGGPVPKSFVHMIDTTPIPVVTNIWAVLSQDPNFSELVKLFVKEGIEIKTLQKSVITYPNTVLAPNDAALRKLAADYGTVVANVSSVIGIFGQDLGDFLRNHIVRGSYSKEALTSGVQLTTEMTPTTSKMVNVSIQGGATVLASDKSSATIVAPSNVEVVYGWSYIQAINYPLVPQTVRLQTIGRGGSSTGGGGSAGTLLPSVLVVLMGLVAALMMI
ncbi:hypothetical protein HXX76_016112 [Chlamydomonas incerta]|uniref:FAS1 domain-containing protein n=1 Tax=Chlamydomonas incerta TaxID=51695 RepID=A0A835VMG2_CHLIN|nr:hypothetical protein HXX76_016112 [Chlamydomonas incerta]|eukprot:KAG2422352.1 hypothetical protein HXX76_016112 [Chlamydomonas incerta]